MEKEMNLLANYGGADPVQQLYSHLFFANLAFVSILDLQKKSIKISHLFY